MNLPTRFILLTFAALAGCTTTRALPADQAPSAATRPATLRPGDLVEFKFPYAPELNDTQQVRADGVVSLQLVGEVAAAGRAPSQLAADLRDAYAAHLKQPEVTVVLRGDLTRRVFVAGEVRVPGAVEMPGDLNTLEAIVLAGGFDLTSAAVGHVVVMRGDRDRVGYRVDLRPALRGEATEPFDLMAGDLVYVPRTAITNVNQFVRQYVGGVVPNGIQATRTNGNTTFGLDTSVFD